MSKPRMSSRLLAGAVLALAVLTAPVAAKAVTFPATSAWIPLTRAGAPFFDPLGDGVNERDIVGDATHPSAYVAQDATNFYFRLRLDKSPLKTDGTYSPFGWGCAIDSDGNSSTIEFIAMVNGITNSGPDGNPDQVEWDYNPTPVADSASDVAEVTVATFAATAPTGYARAIPADTSLGGDQDWFIDWAIPLSTMRAPPATTPPTPGIPSTTTLRFACGSSNNAQRLNADPLGTGTSTLWTDIVSDPVSCGPTSCGADRDGDGVPDSVETTMGTDPTKVDSDGDGINDNVELSPPGSTTGPYSKIDTDGDGTIDALDLDSDNDCLRDTSEKPTWRDATKPGAPSANCASPTPVCNVTTGTCVAGCTTDADCGSATSGQVCSGTTCIAGCRGTGGNGCPAGSTCSSTTSAIGTCGAPLDTDSDGVPDAVETVLGTDPTKADSDGDGINDGTELSATGSTGPFSKIDTDGDGTIDALDLDSDNDCAPDTSEKATWRNSALPNASASANCPTTAPFCDVTVGVCGGCGVDADCGSATSGMVCNGSPKACIAGCRGVGGNTCASGFTCTSTTTAVGSCVAIGDGGVDAMTDTTTTDGATTDGATDGTTDGATDGATTDGAADTSVGDTTVEDTGAADTEVPDTNVSVDSAVTDSTIGDTGPDGAPVPEIGTVEGGGFSCSTSSTRGGSTLVLFGAALLPLLARRRRR